MEIEMAEGESKKKLTLRKTAAPEAPAADADAGQMAAGPMVALPPPGVSHTPAGLMTILCTIIILALLALQYLEWKYYHQDPPPVFPPKQVMM